MGYDRHNAIIVTGYNLTDVTVAHDFAVNVGASVTDVLTTTVNSWHSFMVGPDGSKEFWTESDEGDKRRVAIIAQLKQYRGLDWAEVQYGDGERETRVVDDSDAEDRAHEGK